MSPPSTAVLLLLAYLIIPEVDANGNDTSQNRTIRNTFKRIVNDAPKNRKDSRLQKSLFRKGEFKNYTSESQK